MTSLFAKTEKRILGTTNGWSVNPDPRDLGGQLCCVRLEVQGDDATGYHLVMAPEGFFVADSWHPTRDEALAEAASCFDVPPEAWSADAAD